LNRSEWINSVTDSRSHMKNSSECPTERAAEGGCGVIGFASTVQVAGKHLLQSLSQMRNRGNGKGGGIAAVDLDPIQFGVTDDILENDYLLAMAYLDISVRKEIESILEENYFIDHVHEIEVIEDYKSLEGLDVRPPDAVAYFIRPRETMLAELSNSFLPPHGVPPTEREMEDEFVFQTSFKINTEFYAGERGTLAFVLSHGRNLLVLKMVGYADDVIRYYKLENLKAHIWIGHHRYPTKGKVWHPGGAHPFIGLNEALVHNGDFANYEAVCDYLEQRNLYPLFQTDTEVSAQVFDLHHRLYGYPLELVIESLAPTTERDFILLPKEKQDIYHQIQTTHIHGSPDGPWFFIIAQSLSDVSRLIGITDTSMLRPQVFAIQEGEESIAFSASEKQVIDAALSSLSEEDQRFWPRADKYWNARGGSHTDGGAFIFSVVDGENGKELICNNKFGEQISTKNLPSPHTSQVQGTAFSDIAISDYKFHHEVFDIFTSSVVDWDYNNLKGFIKEINTWAINNRKEAILLLTKMIDRVYPTGNIRRSSLLTLCDSSLDAIFSSIRTQPCDSYLNNKAIEDGNPDKRTVTVNADDYEIEGPSSLALELVRLTSEGWCNFLLYNCRGHRFIANGFGPESEKVSIDVYGSSGDYLASGLDGARLVVHGNGQDQLGQILKSGTLVVHGDVGQTFMYGAKGGHCFILGNAAGRPLINSVGKPRVVINGTSLDYLAESFMAGDPLDDGGFVILNGIEFDDKGNLQNLPTPYPGGNLFSLASGGAIYVRDPQELVTDDQLNGGEFSPIMDADWNEIEPLLRQNEIEFGIPLEKLLEIDGIQRPFNEIYRKIQPQKVKALQAEEAWVAHAKN